MRAEFNPSSASPVMRRIASMLRHGQLVNAKVIEVQADNRVVLKINNQSIEGRTTVPLKQGEEVKLRVSIQDNKLSFKIEDASQQQTVKTKLVNTLKNLGFILPKDDTSKLDKAQTEHKNQTFSERSTTSKLQTLHNVRNILAQTKLLLRQQLQGPLAKVIPTRQQIVQIWQQILSQVTGKPSTDAAKPEATPKQNPPLLTKLISSEVIKRATQIDEKGRTVSIKPTNGNTTANLGQIKSNTTPRLSQSIANLSVGTTITATVANVSAGKITLNMHGQQITTQSQLPLLKGQQVTLEVVQRDGALALRLLQLPSASKSETIANGLRQALPKQESLAPLLANMAQLARSANTNPVLNEAVANLSKLLFSRLPSNQQVSTASGLQQALKDSGLFLEAKLGEQAQAGNKAPIDNDLKANLLRLWQRLTKAMQQDKSQAAQLASKQGEKQQRQEAMATRPDSTRTTTPNTLNKPATANQPLAQTPLPVDNKTNTKANPYQTKIDTSKQLLPPMRDGTPQPQASTKASLAGVNTAQNANAELLRQVVASLARVQLSQLASIAPQENAPQSYTVDLPITQGDKADIFQMLLREDLPEHQTEQEKQQEQAQQWSVTIAFDLQHLGPMTAKITVHDKQVSTTFWAEYPETLAKFGEELPVLRAQLEEEGLEVQDLCCRAANFSNPSNNQINHLLDKNA